MTFRQFQSRLRPLVDRAWRAQCELTGAAPNSRAARDRWYRDQLWTRCRIRSSKGATPPQQTALIEYFGTLSLAGDDPRIDGWSDAQNTRFADLAAAAWRRSCSDGCDGAFHSWLDEVLESCGVNGRHARDRKKSFDDVMAALAVIADDAYWIDRTAQAAEIRMRWQIARYLEDLEYLTKTQHGWSYVCGIWQQAQQLPKCMEDAPAALLRRVLAMLDSHIRRLCKDYGIRPMELPSRSHPHARPVDIHESNGHLHVGHELEHCEPIHVEPRT